MSISKDRKSDRAIGEVRGRAVLVALGLSLFAGGARAADLVAKPAVEQMGGWQGAIGVRMSVIKDRGLDPFATVDTLPQVSLGVARVVVRGRVLALALGLALDTGTTDAQARSAQAHLRITRGSAALELRYRPMARAYAFVRFAPGLLNASASMVDASSPAKLSDSFSVPSFDASVGLAGCLTPARSRVGAWVLADAGYGWTPSHALTLRPELGGADQSKAGGLSLSPLAARGVFARVAVALTY